MIIDTVIEIIAENPPSIAIAGGIILLLASPAYGAFAPWGGGLIALGAILQVLWIFS